MVREVRGTPQAPTRAELNPFAVPVALQFHTEESTRSLYTRVTRHLPGEGLRGIRRRGGSKGKTSDRYGRQFRRHFRCHLLEPWARDRQYV